MPDGPHVTEKRQQNRQKHENHPHSCLVRNKPCVASSAIIKREIGGELHPGSDRPHDPHHEQDDGDFASGEAVVSGGSATKTEVIFGSHRRQ